MTSCYLFDKWKYQLIINFCKTLETLNDKVSACMSCVYACFTFTYVLCVLYVYACFLLCLFCYICLFYVYAFLCLCLFCVYACTVFVLVLCLFYVNAGFMFMLILCLCMFYIYACIMFNPLLCICVLKCFWSAQREVLHDSFRTFFSVCWMINSTGNIRRYGKCFKCSFGSGNCCIIIGYWE